MNEPLPTEATDAYEALRFHVLQPEADGVPHEGRALLMRQGMATWARQCTPSRPTPSPASPPPFVSLTPTFSSDIAAELVRLMADLILSSQEEYRHA